METKVRRIMADILELDPSLITEGTSMDNTGTWGSLAHINLVTALEQEFGVLLEIEEIESMHSFAKIKTVLAPKI